jgi:hypothetical protein
MVNNGDRIKGKLRSRHFAPKEAQPTVIEMSRRSHPANSNSPNHRNETDSLNLPAWAVA